MSKEERSRLRYLTDHLSIAPDRMDYLIHTAEKERMSVEFKKYLEALWNTSSLNETIGQIKKELL